VPRSSAGAQTAHRFEEHTTVADFRLDAETRTEFGKGSARRTRRAGRIPAVLYGHGQDVVHLSLPAREFAAALRNGGSNVLLTVVLDGTEQLALTKAVQRDPLTRVHEHVDLLLVRRGEKATVDVPVIIVGEPAPERGTPRRRQGLEEHARRSRSTVGPSPSPGSDNEVTRAPWPDVQPALHAVLARCSYCTTCNASEARASRLSSRRRRGS
jgi:ribosomal protein L25 (general stress protein Ctc)